ncbi:cytidine deaminase [Lacipirellula limnantheis]|uniref:Cytidine deaminase n=1 Tax=Lacipirellula limnantheis TaxID=2528024 RepID=A0A517TW78_9BACT|nr:cytidine deaminase [Lacipirellula limnantheis]QDT72634.1 Cytidine deaminase [Lacipirellula limnantheis]
MTPLPVETLRSAALAVRTHAHAPYSKFQVGAAVLTSGGEIFAGCNVENASYGLTICAERVAVGAAVAAGHKQIVAVAVVSSGGHSPCGACRQVLSEFGPAMEVILIDADDPTKTRTTTLAALLPEQFSSGAL